MNIILGKKWLPAAIVIIAGLLVFWRIDTRGINEWDEARNGVNAYEMYHSGDFINMSYAGAPDTWNAKPPLLTWLIVGSYRLLGFNAFALRLPAALSILGFFLYALRFGRRIADNGTVLLSCFILLSCTAVLGIHTGLTGDFDALLLFFLLAAAYHFICYTDFGEPNAIYLTALFTGLAFYAKGPAALVYIPGYILYGSIRTGGIKWLKDYRIWVAVSIVLLFICSWILLVIIYGHGPGASHYGSSNAIETMLVYDTWQRLTSTGFEGGQVRNYMFFFEALDVRFNLWNYVFYATVAAGLYQLARHSKAAWIFLKSPENRMLLYSICIILPIALLLTFARYKYDWYLAPAFFFIAYILSAGIGYCLRRWIIGRVIFALLLGFTLLRQGWYINGQSSNAGGLISRDAETLEDSVGIVTIGVIRQDVYLRLTWTGYHIAAIRPAQLSEHRASMLVVDSANLTQEVLQHLQASQPLVGYCTGVVQ